VNLVAAPSIFGGTDFFSLYAAAGWATYIGQLALVSWFVIASIAMETRASSRRHPARLTL
jgi:hypothetical protein